MEYRISEAMEYLSSNPEAKVAAVARQFDIPRGRLRNRLGGRPPKNQVPASNMKLSLPEEAALRRYIDRLDAVNLAVRAESITDAANLILRERASKAEQAIPPTVGTKWTTRFIKRNKYHRRLQKTLNKDRQASEDVNRVAEYFEKLRIILTVAAGRQMVVDKKENEEEKLAKRLAVIQGKKDRDRERCPEDAARRGRSWRIKGRLEPAEVLESIGGDQSSMTKRYMMKLLP